MSLFIISPTKLKKRKKQRKNIIFGLLASFKSNLLIKIKVNKANKKATTSNIFNPKIQKSQRKGKNAKEGRKNLRLIFIYGY